MTLTATKLIAALLFILTPNGHASTVVIGKFPTMKVCKAFIKDSAEDVTTGRVPVGSRTAWGCAPIYEVGKHA